jgi:hypothetical protein
MDMLFGNRAYGNGVRGQTIDVVKHYIGSNFNCTFVSITVQCWY